MEYPDRIGARTRLPKAVKASSPGASLAQREMTNVTGEPCRSRPAGISMPLMREKAITPNFPAS